MPNDPNQAAKQPDQRLRDRIEASISRDPVFGCHLWTGKLDVHGYGTLYLGGPRQAHRVTYAELVGPIAPGLKLDHLCRRRRCIWEVHLEPVTEAENQLRRNPRYLARRPRCRNGHPLEHPLRTPEGGLLCRVCQGPPRPPRDPYGFPPELLAAGAAQARSYGDHPLARAELDEDDEP